MTFTLTLRRKFVIAFAAVALFVAALVGVISYTVTEHSLRSEIDRSLVSAATTLSAGGTVTTEGLQTTREGQRSGEGRDQGIIQAAQTIATDGTVTLLVGQQLPLDPDAQQLQSGSAGSQRFESVVVHDTSYRVMTQALGDGNGAIQVARDLGETENVLEDLAWSIVWIGLGVLLAAAGVGWFAARQITRRLTSLTAAAEQVSSTGVLDVGIATRGNDEVTRLGAAMQSMLSELGRSREDQQRLVQDAGHELRTPLTSLRTNASVLRRFDELSPGSRTRLLDDVDLETRELTNLVNELVELATDRRDTEQLQAVHLAELAERVAVKFRRRTGRTIAVEHEPGLEPVLAQPHSVERAISNLIDNALKFDSNSEEPIEVRVSDSAVRVSDHGPGLTEEDLAHVFDRFYRATEARSLPGSGLGLSIVRDVATTHGGSVVASNRAGGGAVIGFTLRSGLVLPNS